MNNNNHYYKKEDDSICYIISVAMSIFLFLVFAVPSIVCTALGYPMLLLVFFSFFFLSYDVMISCF
jgi:hypothetical protein